jgi:CBS-domain-containing membrane protein
MEARDIMIRHVVTVTPNMSVQEAIDLLLHHRIHGAPVVDEAQNIVGMVSFVDLAGRTGDRVSDVMVPAPILAAPDTPVEQIAATMLDQMVRRVVVVQGRRVVGIVSASDIIQVFLNLHERMRSLRQELGRTSPAGEAIPTKRVSARNALKGTRRDASRPRRP